jgi:hypothetical protein
MQDKIAKVTQDAIEKLQTKIATLEQELTVAKADLKIREEILRLATHSSSCG